jgi:hypothetical protein
VNSMAKTERPARRSFCFLRSVATLVVYCFAKVASRAMSPSAIRMSRCLLSSLQVPRLTSCHPSISDLPSRSPPFWERLDGLDPRTR